MSKDVKDRLRDMRIGTDSEIETLIHCWVIELVAQHLLSAGPELFWRPFYNTPLVPMLRARAHEQVVWVYAWLCGSALCKSCHPTGKKQSSCTKVRCDKPLTDGTTLRGLDHLKNHRDVVGHPLTHQLDRAAVRKFVADKRDRRDLRPAVLWDVHRSIVDAQIAAGDVATVLDVKFGPNETQVLDSILRLCLKPDVPPPIPDAAMPDFMAKIWEKGRVEFEKYPDGQLPPKTDAERKAIWEKMKGAWAASR
ncbi:MAG TPA: hypothetical protein VGP64_17285 [Polyangia bacterium]